MELVSLVITLALIACFAFGARVGRLLSDRRRDAWSGRFMMDRCATAR